MTFLNDLELLAKKIIVTVIIYLVPVTLVVGGLLLTQRLLNDDDPHQDPIGKIESKIKTTKLN